MNKLTLGRFRKAGNVFEIAIDPEHALAFKEGKQRDLNELVNSQDIFTDASKGLLAGDDELEKAFATTDKETIIRKIIKEGEIQLTAEQRKQFKDRKEKRILDMIHASVVDPKTHLPHPPTRIKLAMEQGKVRISDNKSAEDQVDDIIKQLQVILPMKSEKKTIAVRVPAAIAAKTYAQIKAMVKTEKEEWLNDGSLRVVFTVPAAVEQEIYDKLNQIAHGGIETEVLEIR